MKLSNAPLAAAVVAVASLGGFAAVGAASSTPPPLWSTGVARVTVAEQHSESPLKWRCIGQGGGQRVKITVQMNGDSVVQSALVYRKFSCQGPDGTVAVQAS